MARKRYLLISSFIAIIISLCIIAGSTFAAGSLENVQNFAVRAGNIEVVATADNLKLYSAVKVENPDVNDELIYDENNNTYKYVECNDGQFTSGGTAEQAIIETEDNKEVHTVTLFNIVAGDKVEFDIHVKNNSNVAINYSTWIEVVAGLNESYDKDFFHGLDITLSSEGKGLASVTNETQSYTGQTTIRAGQQDVEDVHVSISLPMSAGSEYMDKSISLSYRVQAIAATQDVATVDGRSFETLGEAVEYAKSNNLDTINIINDVYGEVLVIDAPMKFSGVAGDIKFSDTVFRISDGPYLEMENIDFAGNTYLDASDASKVVVNNCKINVTPDKLYDYSNRKTLSRAGFVVSTTEQTSALELEFTGNTIISSDADSAAIFLGRKLANGSVIEDNTFGSAEEAYSSSVIAFVGAEGNSTINVTNNTVYGKTAVEIGQNVYTDVATVAGTENFVLYSTANKVMTDGNLARIAGRATFLDNGSVINGQAVQLSDITAESMLFCGVNVVLDLNKNITAGDFLLSPTLDIAVFKEYYVAASANGANITVYYADGTSTTLAMI